nr:GT-D fold domain-containing glycosyltransferase [uncultured Butyrivibrio sp.]
MIKILIKKILAEVAYCCYRIGNNIGVVEPTVRVMSVDETIDELMNSNKSLVRFGDGELKVIRGGTLEFQEADKELADELTDLIGYRYDDLMVSVQDIFGNLDMYVAKSQTFWKDHLLFYRKYYKKLCNPRRVYASTSFSRSYITIADKSQSCRWFEKAKRIWKDKDVVIVEGKTTYNGVGNDLLDGCKSVRRIICPSTNAYGRIDEIRAECLTMPEDVLFLVTLGPAAKPLVRDLYLAGYRAIDLGQMDSEYDMFLAGAKEKIATPKPDNLVGIGSKYQKEIVVNVE